MKTQNIQKNTYVSSVDMTKHTNVVFKAGSMAGVRLGKILSNLIDDFFDSLTKEEKDND